MDQLFLLPHGHVTTRDQTLCSQASSSLSQVLVLSQAMARIVSTSSIHREVLGEGLDGCEATDRAIVPHHEAREALEDATMTLPTALQRRRSVGPWMCTAFRPILGWTPPRGVVFPPECGPPDWLLL